MTARMGSLLNAPQSLIRFLPCSVSDLKYKFPVNNLTGIVLPPACTPCFVRYSCFRPPIDIQIYNMPNFPVQDSESLAMKECMSGPSRLAKQIACLVSLAFCFSAALPSPPKAPLWA